MYGCLSASPLGGARQHRIKLDSVVEIFTLPLGISFLKKKEGVTLLKEKKRNFGNCIHHIKGVPKLLCITMDSVRFINRKLKEKSGHLLIGSRTVSDHYHCLIAE